MLAYATELLRVQDYGQVAPTMLAALADVVGGNSACLTHLDLDRSETENQSATVSRHLHRIYLRQGLANRAAAAGLYLRMS